MLTNTWPGWSDVPLYVGLHKIFMPLSPCPHISRQCPTFHQLCRMCTFLACKGSNTVGLMGKSPKVTGLQFLINKMETITKKWISSLHWQMQFLSLRFHTRQKMAWSSRAHHSWLKKCWNCQIWFIKYTTMYGFIHIEIQRWLPDRNAAGRTEIKENTGAYKDHTLVYLYVSIAC